jgi:hypothetical protein
MFCAKDASISRSASCALATVLDSGSTRWHDRAVRVERVNTVFEGISDGIMHGWACKRVEVLMKAEQVEDF